MNKFMRGSPLLVGDNTVPGLKLPPELAKVIPKIIQECKNFGLDFYPIIIQKLTYDEMSEVASYGGFPVRYPHWKWGMEYEELARGYEHGMHKIYEMVINTNPCYIYCLDSNTMVDDVTVIAHAIGHNDFFKNNVFFRPTSENMMNQLANDGTRIRRYISRWGKERVTEFIDYVLRLETLVDPSKAWDQKVIKDPVVRDVRNYHHPDRLPIKEGHEYMGNYINPKEWVDEQYEKIEKKEIAEELDLFKKPTKDILGYLRDHAPLKPWQADILAMLYNEIVYFTPQRTTKMANEGWASYVDYGILARGAYASEGLEGDECGIIEYAKHKAGVLGGKYSLNPYKLGFCLFLDIEERWNKGQFGQEWADCDDLKKKEDWDQQLGLGAEKVLEVRKYYNDYQMLAEFFTSEFCNKYEFFEWKKFPNGETVLVDRDPKSIKEKLMRRYLNGGLPEIKLVDPNHKGNGSMMLQHVWDERVLYRPYIDPTLRALCGLWGKSIYLASKTKNGDEIVYCCSNPRDAVKIISREQHEKLS